MLRKRAGSVASRFGVVRWLDILFSWDVRQFCWETMKSQSTIYDERFLKLNQHDIIKFQIKKLSDL